MPALTFLLWFCLVWGAGWLFFPLGRRIFAGILPDAGLAVSRALFLTLWTLGAFWLGYIGVSTHWSCWLWVVLAALGGATGWRERVNLREEIRTRRRAILSTEAVFLALFLVFFVLRGFWSDTNGSNGEKSMDGALVSTLVRAQSLPPLNPFSAGMKLEAYYYFGHLETALLTNAVGTQTRWSYNLMCATVPALCFSILFSLGAALTGRLKGGVFVMLCVLCLGTLQPLTQWQHITPNWAAVPSLLARILTWWRPDALGNPAQPFLLNFFDTSRVIPYTINEFPWFTFHQADLHAHYLAFPFVLTAICLAYAVYRGSNPARWLGMVVLGTLILTNTWDFPAYGLLIGLALLFVRPNREREEAVQAATGEEDVSIGRPSLAARLGLALLIMVGALLVAMPYLLHLKTAATPPQALAQPASVPWPWLQMWGVGTFAYVLFLWFLPQVKESLLPFWIPLFAATIWGVLLLTTGQNYSILILIVALGLWTMERIWNSRPEHRFLFLMSLCGLLALLWAETTWAGFLGDPDNPKIEGFIRQDTVFKFGLQTWFLWGIATASGAYLTLSKWPKILRWAFVPALCVMSIASLSVLWGRTHWFGTEPGSTLERVSLPDDLLYRWFGIGPGSISWQNWDGWAHLAPSEQEAASWLLKNVKPDENILEAESLQGGDFSEFARYSSLTGIPTVVGPLSHSFYWCPTDATKKDAAWLAADKTKVTWPQYLGGKSWEAVYQRKNDARAIYSIEDDTQRQALLGKYGVRYIVFGNLEMQEYGARSFDRLRSRWRQAAQFGALASEHRVWIFENRPTDSIPTE